MSEGNRVKSKFQVWGLAWVPVRVLIDVEARDADDAMKKAKRIFDQSGKRPYIKEGSEDYDAAQKYDPLDAYLL